MHRESLWCILWAYGIPQQIIDIIKSFYNNFTCRVDNSETSFEVKTGIGQGCTMSAMLFNMTIGWVMRHTTEDQSRGITEMDRLLNAGGPRFCRWSSLGPPYSPTHAGKDDPTQYLRTASWLEDQPKEDRSDAVERVQPYTSSSERRRPANNWRVHLPGQHNKAWWKNREWHQEPSQQGQKSLHNAQQRVEFLSVQHQDQAEDLPKLCDVHAMISLWMLEEDREQNHQAVSLPHKEPQENPASLLAWHHL